MDLALAPSSNGYAEEVGEKSSDLVCLEVRCDRDAPSVVREALDTALEDSVLREDARLIASELVTNAVRWSGCGPDQLIEVRASLSDQALRISVSDACVSGQTAHLRAPADLAKGGFGLRIVDRVAARWGSEHPNGQRVWAELAVSR